MIKIALSIILKELYNMSNVLELTIPASTANLGVGFDSIGMALDKFASVCKGNIRDKMGIYFP